jgi:hypothetical protein
MIEVVKDLWPALIASLILMLITKLSAVRGKMPRASTLVSMFLGAVVLIVWTSAISSITSHGAWWFIPLHAVIGVLAFGWILVLGIRERHVRWWWLLVVNGCIAASVTGIVWFTGAKVVASVDNYPWFIIGIVEVVWPGLVISSLLLFITTLPVVKGKAPQPRALAEMFYGPAILLVWSTAMYGCAKGNMSWLFALYTLFGFLSLMWIIHIGSPTQRVRWWWMSVVNGLVAGVVTFVVWFIGGMALMNSWL